MALGQEHVIPLTWDDYTHVGAVGESWLAVYDGSTEGRYIVEATSGATVSRTDKIGSPLRPDHALGGASLAGLLADGVTAAGHVYLRGQGRVVRTDLADGVAAPGA